MTVPVMLTRALYHPLVRVLTCCHGGRKYLNGLLAYPWKPNLTHLHLVAQAHGLLAGSALELSRVAADAGEGVSKRYNLKATACVCSPAACVAVTGSEPVPATI